MNTGSWAFRRSYGLFALALFFLAGCGPSSSEPEPFFTQVLKIIASDARDWDKFGWSVALDGSHIIIGTDIVQSPYMPEGRAYIHERNSGGTDAWGEVAEFIAGDGLDMDLFGYAVAVRNDAAAVGAPWEDNAEVDAGAARVYARDQGGAGAWGETKRLVASDGGRGDSFGQAVSLDADTAIVGAPGNSGAAMRGGAVYAFSRNQGGENSWNETAKIVPGDPQDAANFGSSVSLAGDIAVIGAFGDDGGGFRRGAAYVFDRSGGALGTWSETKKLTAPDGADEDEFGISVAASGGLVIVGADLKHEAGVAIGAAYIFGRDQGGIDNWGLVTRLSAPDAKPNDAFGISVAISDEYALVGAAGADGSAVDAGAVYVFKRDLGGVDNWGYVGKVRPLVAAGSAQFGRSVALAGDLFVVGAPIKPEGGVYRGAVYLFRIDP